MKGTQLLAAASYFPKRLSTCDRPQCCNCHFGKVRKKAWRSKSKSTEQILQHIHRKPGSIAHTDIMTSSVGGLMPQMIGFLTRERFQHTHVFIDDDSDLTFAFHTKTTDVAEALDAK